MIAALHLSRCLVVLSCRTAFRLWFIFTIWLQIKHWFHLCSCYEEHFVQCRSCRCCWHGHQFDVSMSLCFLWCLPPMPSCNLGSAWLRPYLVLHLGETFLDRLGCCTLFKLSCSGILGSITGSVHISRLLLSGFIHCYLDMLRLQHKSLCCSLCDWTLHFSIHSWDFVLTVWSCVLHVGAGTFVILCWFDWNHP